MRGDPMRTGEGRRQVNGVWGLWILLIAALVMGGVSEGEGAYRLVFQNGSAFEVSAYEDLGEAIRFQRHGGSIVVPKASLASVTEVPDPPPSSSTPTPRPVPATPPAGVQYPGQGSFPPASLPGVASSRVPAQTRPAPSRVLDAFPSSLLLGTLTTLWYFIPLLGCLAAIWFGIQILIRRNRLPDPSGESLPYEKVDSLLTAAERSLYGALCQGLDSRNQIFAKVRLSDIVKVPRGTPRAFWYRSRVNQKHVDFVLCRATDLTPQLVIELDDSSHARQDRRNRDAFVDAALAAAGLPILHVHAQRAYAPAELRAIIEDRMQTDRPEMR